MRKITLINLLLALFFFSCQNDFDYMEDKKNDNNVNFYKVSVDEAKEIALQFAEMFQDSSALTKGVSRTVENVEIVRVNKAMTKSTEFENGMDTLLYAVNFSGSNGFALVGADRRTDPIFGIIDSGSFSEKNIASNPSFAYFLEQALEKAVCDINETEETVTTRALSDYENVFFTSFSLSTKWSQGAPYNKYCPGPYTGCVAVAVAQVLSRFPVLGQVSWQHNNTFGSAVLNWNRILSDCRSNNGRLDNSTPESTNEVAHLMRYLGVALKADYKSDGTSIDSDDAIKWFNDWTRLNASKLKSFNSNEVMMAASVFSNKLVYMRGNSGRKKFLGITVSYTGGHAWVVDGACSAIRKSDRKLVNLLHCNWGWGGSYNGYFLAGVFDSRNAAISDWELTRGSEGNYKYNIEYSIIQDPQLPSLIIM